MELQDQERPAGPEARPAAKSGGFIVAMAFYYLLYYFVFAGRVTEYLRDLSRHFAFVRRLL